MGFTPGPWRAMRHCVWGEEEHDQYIAGIDRGLSEDEQQANLRLIAAAPDLLAACKAALQLPLAYHPEAFDNATIRLIESAIAKAEGGEP